MKKTINMIERLKIMLSEYDIEYTQSKVILIRTPIKPQDLKFIRDYFNMYRIPYNNIVVETWSDIV